MLRRPPVLRRLLCWSCVGFVGDPNAGLSGDQYTHRPAARHLHQSTPQPAMEHGPFVAARRQRGGAEGRSAAVNSRETPSARSELPPNLMPSDLTISRTRSRLTGMPSRGPWPTVRCYCRARLRLCLSYRSSARSAARCTPTPTTRARSRARSAPSCSTRSGSSPLCPMGGPISISRTTCALRLPLHLPQ